jgi:hypothetical protein
MTYIELLRRNTWLSVQPILLQNYPDQEHVISEYEHIYQELLIMETTQTEMTIEIYERFIEGLDDEPITIVCGQKKNDKESYAIEFVPWNEWLSMNIHTKSLEHYTELEIIAHCLYEMTFIDFDQNGIQAEIKKLEAQASKIDEMTEAEKKKHFIPWEDIKKKYNNPVEDE